MTTTGTFVWHEHMTKDVKAAIAFYTEVIGWKTEAFGGDYTMWVSSQGPMGGVTVLPDKAAQMGAPPHWMGHVTVADVDATVEKIKRLGGQLYHGPEDVPTVGRFAVVADPQGAVLSIFKPEGDMQPHSPDKVGEFCWNELYTADPEAAAKFYGEIFGWKVIQAMDMGAMGTYRVFGFGDKGMGGMMKPPPGTPNAWLYYIEAGDLDATIARATARGAKVVNGPMPVPGGARIAQLVDPQGAMFALHAMK